MGEGLGCVTLHGAGFMKRKDLETDDKSRSCLVIGYICRKCFPLLFDKFRPATGAGRAGTVTLEYLGSFGTEEMEQQLRPLKSFVPAFDLLDSKFYTLDSRF